jgi:hypothetical protein
VTDIILEQKRKPHRHQSLPELVIHDPDDAAAGVVVVDAARVVDAVVLDEAAAEDGDAAPRPAKSAAQAPLLNSALTSLICPAGLMLKVSIPLTSY